MTCGLTPRAAIDAGLPLAGASEDEALARDIDGEPRDAMPDLGAYEWIGEDSGEPSATPEPSPSAEPTPETPEPSATPAPATASATNEPPAATATPTQSLLVRYRAYLPAALQP